ncbi:MAG: M12 family metallopeptidase, partial [Solirubrobacterales bacterium]
MKRSAPRQPSRAPRTTPNQPPGPGAARAGLRRMCAIREGPPRQFPSTLSGERARLIIMHADKWVNGTVVKYAFFEPKESFTRWAGTDALRSQARKAFQRYMDLGIGVRFEPVTERASAQIRVGFEEGDGHWSYVGRQVLRQGVDDRTMNLDPSDRISSGDYGVDVATHEIGHTLGFPHEHQNPNAGIVWDEEAVYRALGGPPNNWSREMTFHNIIRKIQPDQVQGSSWDPDSVMHYPFEPGLILKPEQYRQGLQPAGGLSQRDREWVHTFYPPLTPADDEELTLLEAKRLQITPGQQRTFVLKPTVDRYYEIRTFGASDTVIVLLERTPSGREAWGARAGPTRGGPEPQHPPRQRRGR